MFKKVPYGLKVRIRGDHINGYKVEECLHASRFFPFMDYWAGSPHVFKTLDDAKKFAKDSYDRWIVYYERKAQEAIRLNKVSKTIVWEFP